MIFSYDTQEYELVGVTSFRNACITEGLFTRVAPFINWILPILENPPSTPALFTLPSTVPTTTKPEILGI